MPGRHRSQQILRRKIVLSITRTVGFNRASSSPLPFPVFLSCRRRHGAAARQLTQSLPAEGPVRLLRKNAPADTQDGMRAGELVGRSANVHVSVVQDEVLEMDKFAFEPKRGGRVGEILPLDEAFAHWRTGQALVEARQSGSGASRARPALTRLYREIAAGDALVVVRLGRLARSVSHLLGVIENLTARTAHLSVAAESDQHHDAPGCAGNEVSAKGKSSPVDHPPTAPARDKELGFTRC